MANTIRLKQGTGSDPSASDLVLGEPAVRTDTGEIFLLKDNGSIAKVAGGIDDGDKGDITVSNSGATFTIDSGVVNNAKIASDAAISLSKLEVITSNRIVGNDSGNAVPKELTAANVRTIINVEDGATADQTASEILTLIKTVDGSGSGLDADLLDGSTGADYLNASNLSSGSVPAARLDTATTQSAGNNSTKIATTAYTDTAISNLINGAPAALDTLNELAAAMNDDAAFSTTVTNSLATKLPLAGGSLTGNLTINDGVAVNVGTDADLLLYHTSDNSYVQNTNNSNYLFIKGDNISLASNSTGENYLVANVNDGVDLYFNGNVRFATTDDGATLTGRMLPAANDTYGFGSSGARWANFYAVAGNFSGNITASGTVDGRDLASDGSKLDGIESGATADQSASEILTLIKTVDGSGSGLDADLLDGISSANFLRSNTADSMSAKLTLNQDNDDEKLVLAGTSNPYIRWQEGTTNKAYIQWHSDGYLLLWNSEETNGIKIDDVPSWYDGSQYRTMFHAGNLTVGDGGLTQNNFTNTLKSKLDGIASSATNVTNNNQLTNGAGYITSSGTAAACSGNAATADHADIADSVDVSGVTTNADFQITFSTSNDGAGRTIAVDSTSSKFTYNPNSNTLKVDNITASLTGNASGSSGSCTGNAATATTLATARTIAGVSFDGSANISLNNNAITNGAGYTTFTANQAVDTSSAPTFANVYTNNWFRNNNSGHGLYNQATGQHWYSDDDDYWNIAGGGSANAIRFRDDHAGTIRGYCYANSSNQIGFLDSDGNWAIRADRDVDVGFRINGTLEATVLPDTFRIEGCFFENAQAVAANKTISDGYNAMSAGPITINSGVTVTIGSGEAWTIV